MFNTDSIILCKVREVNDDEEKDTHPVCVCVCVFCNVWNRVSSWPLTHIYRHFILAIASHAVFVPIFCKYTHTIPFILVAM